MKSRPWTVAAQLAAFPVGVETTISISDQIGELPAQLQRPTAELRMLDMAMAAVAVSLDEQTTGIWRGLTRLPMPGTWSFIVKLNGEEIAFPVSVPAEER